MTTWLKELTIKSFILSSNELPKLPRAGLTGTIGQGSWWPLIKTQGTSGFVNILNWNWFDLSNTPQYHWTKLKAKGKHHLSNKFIPRRFSPALPREECVTERIGYVIPSRSSVETPSDEAGWRGLTSSFSIRNWGLRCSLGGVSLSGVSLSQSDSPCSLNTFFAQHSCLCLVCFLGSIFRQATFLLHCSLLTEWYCLSPCHLCQSGPTAIEWHSGQC